MRLRFALLVIIICFGTSTAVAQVAASPVALDSGALVRVTPRIGVRFEGRLIERFPAGGPTLTMCRYPGPPCTERSDSILVRKADVTSVLHLEVQHGNHAGSGALIGGGIGVLLGLALRPLVHGLCDTSACAHDGAHAPITIGIAGAVVGAIFGWASPRWGPAQVAR